MDPVSTGDKPEELGREKVDISLLTSPTTTYISSFPTNLKLRDDIEKQSDTIDPDITLWKVCKAQFRRLWCGGQHEENDGSPKVRRLSQCPNGYPRLSAYLDSDQNFMMYRRFGYIQSRLLLAKQDDLRQLEEELEAQDQAFWREHPGFTQTRDHSGDTKVQHKELMNRLEKTYCEYAQLMIAARDMVSLNRPAAKDHRSVRNWIESSNPMSESEESDWIYCREDLVTLRPGREHAWLDSTIEYVLKWLHCSLIERIFCSRETRQKTIGLTEDDGHVVYYTPTRIEGLVVGIIVVILLALLIIPVWLLYHLVTQVGIQRTDALCIGILLVFTLAFSAILSLFTRAKRHEILAAAAGYCAVLVVFLGNVNISNGQISG